MDKRKLDHFKANSCYKLVKDYFNKELVHNAVKQSSFVVILHAKFTENAQRRDSLLKRNNSGVLSRSSSNFIQKQMCSTKSFVDPTSIDWIMFNVGRSIIALDLVSFEVQCELHIAKGLVTCFDVNAATKSENIEVIIGCTSGEIVYWCPLTGKNVLFNKAVN